MTSSTTGDFATNDLSFTGDFDVHLYGEWQTTAVDAVLDYGQFGEGLQCRRKVQNEEIVLITQPHIRVDR